MRPLLTLPLLLGLAALPTAQDIQLERRQTRWRFGLESFDTGTGGDAILLGVHYDLLGLSEAYPSLYAGVGGFASVSGGENGFFLGGLEAGWIWSPRPRWILDAGLLVGAGGPAGAPEHRGFATRPYLAAERVFGLWALRGEVALFDLNDIEEDLVFSLGISLPSELLLARAGRSSSKIPDAAIVDRRTRVTSRYGLRRPDSGTTRTDGTVLPEDQHLIGLGIDYFMTPRLYLPVELWGGAGGGAEGFLQAGVGLGTSRPLGDSYTSFEAKALAITGGGGGFVTGDGLGWEAHAGLRMALSARFALELLYGRTSFAAGDYDANAFTVGLSWSAHALELALDYPRERLGREGLSRRRAKLAPARIAVVNKFAVPPSSATKKNGDELDTTLSLIGVEVEQPVGDGVALTGRALGAWDGNVGGFSQGLFGLQGSWGFSHDPRHQFLLRGEVGAAGGGEVDISGGLLFVLNAGWRYELLPQTFLTIEVGSEQASEGSYEAEVITLGLGWGFSRAELR